MRLSSLVFTLCLAFAAAVARAAETARAPVTPVASAQLGPINALRVEAGLMPMTFAQLGAVQEQVGPEAAVAVKAGAAAVWLLQRPVVAAASDSRREEALAALSAWRERSGTSTNPALRWLDDLSTELISRPDRPSSSAQDAALALDAYFSNARPSSEGFFGPESMIWRVNGHQAVLATGPRAFLLQSADPRIAESSRISRQLLKAPVPRLERTLAKMRQIMFGDLATAKDSVDFVNRRHRAIKGTLEEAVGEHPAGEAFTAMDPPLLKWALASLYDTSVQAYERYVRPLTNAEKDRYFDDYKRFGQFLGISPREMPESRREFEAYFQRTLEDGSLAVGAVGRQLVSSLYSPPGLSRPLRLLVEPFMSLVMAWNEGLMPDSTRQLYGLAMTKGRQRVFALIDATMRVVMPLLPRALGYSSLWRKAMARVGVSAAGQGSQAWPIARRWLAVAWQAVSGVGLAAATAATFYLALSLNTVTYPAFGLLALGMLTGAMFLAMFAGLQLARALAGVVRRPIA